MAHSVPLPEVKIFQIFFFFLFKGVYGERGEAGIGFVNSKMFPVSAVEQGPRRCLFPG